MHLEPSSIFFRKNLKSVNFESLKLLINDKVIERVGTGCKTESFKFDGINLDEYLTWSYHIKAVKNKNAVLTLAKERNLLPSNIKLTIHLYTSYNSCRIWNILFGQKCMS